MFTRIEIKRKTVTDKKGRKTTIILYRKTRDSTGKTVYEVNTGYGSVDAKTKETAEKNFQKSVTHFENRK